MQRTDCCARHTFVKFASVHNCCARFHREIEGGFAITSAGQAILNNAEGMEVAALAVERLVSGHDARASGLVELATIEMRSQ
jgi:hypothetical protein